MKRTTLMALALAAAPVAALADPSEGWREGYGHMMYGGGYGMYGGLMMLVFWGIIIALIVMAVRWFSDGRGGSGRSGAMDTLRNRFASGEIDEDEFNRRKRALES